MAKKSSIAKAVLITLLVLPSVLYFIFVYGAEGNFFVTLDYVGPKTVVEKEVEGELVSDTLYYKIPPFQFTTQDNELLSSEDMLGKIYVANFFFSTCPTVCPAMNYNLQQVQDRFIGYEYIDFLSFTVDPDHDTVEVLKAYEQKIGAVNGRWYFLTGEKEEIYKTAANFFLSAQVDEDAPGGFLHSENLVLVDWEGRIRSRKDEQGNLKAVYSGTSPVEINELKDDIKVLIAEYEKTKSVNEYRESKEKK
ncbi:MAG: SCO family protein [Bacteroidetes bacterium]|nr:SCO family protein [Bacteroidota bacterium]